MTTISTRRCAEFRVRERDVKDAKEGETRTVVRTRVRVGCGQCSERAVKRHSYLLPGARRNRASAAYGKDDISWCSDHEEFTCAACPQPEADGYEWCSTFSVAPGKHQFAHMFLRWTEQEVINPAKAAGRANKF